MKILLIDDHAESRQSIAGLLGQLGHAVVQVDNGQAALDQVFALRPALVLSDLRMPGMDGLHLLDALEALDDPPPLALMTAFGNTETAIEALRLGAIDYLRKPIDVLELHRLIERVDLSRPGAPRDRGEVQAREEPDGVIICSDAFSRIITLADRLHTAPDLPCLIEGETGTGKELIARRIHHGGSTSSAPFVAINCAAITSGLFESELFGYAPGAFTGALGGGSPGKFALAAGGTLLLDEISDLPLDQQAKLLRVLEDRSWYPVGSNQLQRLKTRVICACHADLLEQMRSGRFREDLYYRLKVGHVRLPPLRDRREDIIPMARRFLVRIRQSRGHGFVRMSASAEKLLCDYSWPGNVRQLNHLLEQASVLLDGDEMGEGQLRELLPPATLGTSHSARAPWSRVADQLDLPPDGFDLDAWISTVVKAALRRNHGSPVHTATYLSVTRKVLYTLRKRYGLLGWRGDPGDPGA